MIKNTYKEKTFFNAGCNVCHRDSLQTIDKTPEFPQLANQVFHPYTDLMIHDMGQGLADNFPEFDASGKIGEPLHYGVLVYRKLSQAKSIFSMMEELQQSKGYFMAWWRGKVFKRYLYNFQRMSVRNFLLYKFFIILLFQSSLI